MKYRLKPLFGDDARYASKPYIIAGPCSAESRAQVLDTAAALAACGVKIFRAGVWKPRTKPGGFEGMGSPALAWLAEAARCTGMLAATEVASARHVEEALAADINVLWIGARTSANPFAVQEIADTLATLPPERRDAVTILVKNPVNPDLELWIGAIERIYGAGICRLGAVHRGFSTYGAHLYRNPPQWRIPIELHRRIPELPILCDPSHIAGRRDLVASLAQQAFDMDFAGVAVEVHCRPESALSDAAQQLTPNAFARMMAGLHRRKCNPDAGADDIDELRRQIDAADDELLDILARRMEISERIGLCKKQQGMQVVQPRRYKDLMERRAARAIDLGLSPDFVRGILAAVHEESVRRQLEL